MATQIKQIPLLGLSTNPNDLIADDGNLAEAVNVHHDLQSIVPVGQTSPSLICDMGTKTVIYQHKNEDYTHFIVDYSSGSTYAYGYSVPDDPTEIVDEFSDVDEEIVAINALGNTLVFYLQTKVVYYLWKSITGTYKSLGSGLPFFDISFKLGYYRLKYQHQASSKYFAVDVSEDTNSSFIVEADLPEVTTAVTGAVNAATSLAHQNNCFTQPFLVCAAIRMYGEDSYSRITPPVLMLANSTAPILPLYEDPGENDKVKFYVFMHAHKLYFKISSDDVTALKEYSELISSIDIFVSEPIYTYYPDENIECFVESISKRLARAYSRSEFLGYDLANTEKEPYESDLTALDVDGDNWAQSMFSLKELGGYDTGQSDGYDRLGCYYSLLMKEKNMEEILDDLSHVSTFYHLKSYTLEELDTSGGFVEVEFSKSLLDALTTREVLTFNYNEYNAKLPSISRVYNSRFNFAKFKESKFEGYNLETMLQYTNYVMSGTSPTFYYAVYIEQPNVGTQIVVGRMSESATTCGDALRSLFYFYYPDIYAKKVVFFAVGTYGTNTYYSAELTLKRHEGLDGAFVVANNVSLSMTTSTYFNEVLDALESTSGIQYENNNQVYTSETNNPFVFKAANVETIGNGKIIALVPQAQAMSQGQFGEFPMIAFTTDGIWALSVNTTGGWAASQPFTRDVVLNEDAGNILQLDKQIMFATERGLMLMAGKDVECISQLFDGPKDAFNIYATQVTSDNDGPEFINSSVLYLYSDINTTRTDIEDATSLFHDFKTFIGDAVFLYDYTHQRIIIGNPSYPIAYVYNMEDKAWTTMAQKIKSAINSYPQCYAMTESADGTSNYFVDFSATDGTASDVDLPENGWLLTRPIKLGDGTSLKTIRTINAQGQFVRSHVSLVLLGSNDNALRNWFLLSSSVGGRMAFKYGTPFKYFRIGILTQLESGESLSSLTIEFEHKETNKLRQ